MAKKDRTGNRKKRDQRKQFKVPELGYYLIVTDTEATECCFFTGLHQALPEDVRNKLVIKVVETKTRTMIDKCLELTAYDAQYRIPWIVFDRDQVQGFDERIKEYKRAGLIHVLKYGCMPILVPCRQSKNLGLVAQILDECMKPRPGKSIPRQMSRCMENSAKLVTRKRQSR